LVSIRSFSGPFKRFSVTIGKLFSSVHDFISRDKSRRLPTYVGERNLLSAFNFKYIPMLLLLQLKITIPNLAEPPPPPPPNKICSAATGNVIFDWPRTILGTMQPSK
jgi:hypothetical protein